MRTALLLLLALRAVAAEPFFFIQASDPQFGMFTANRDFRQETANWEFVVATINRLNPAFVVVTGDLTNAGNNADQIAEYKRINAKLNPAIHLYNVAGNHDVGNDPTTATLAAYRRNYGPDYYSFREGNLYGIVLDSSLFKAPALVRGEAADQEKWLVQELAKAAAANSVPVVFQHIPFFLEKADEPDQYFNIPKDTRRRVIGLLHAGGIHYIFAGHYHRNAFGRDGELEMITSGPAGMPLGPDPSGIRIAELQGTQIKQQYFGLGTLPGVYPAPPVRP